MHGETSYAKMAVVCTCPASSGAVALIILQVLRGHAFCDTWNLFSIRREEPATGAAQAASTGKL